MKRWKTRNLKATASVLVVVLVATCALAKFFKVRGLNDLEAYIGMASECHPIWKQLAMHRVGLGDPVENLLKLGAPDKIDRFGRYSLLHYGPGGFTSLVVGVKSNHLLFAGAASCTWKHGFFGEMSEEAQFDSAYRQYLKQRWEEREQLLEEQEVRILEEAFLTQRDLFIGKNVSPTATFPHTAESVRVTKVLQGSQTVGSVLKIPKDCLFTPRGYAGESAVYTATDQGEFWCVSTNALKKYFPSSEHW